MNRPVTLFTGQWADLPLEVLAGKAAEWGYDGLELACWGDHFDVRAALADASYCRERRDLLARHGLGVWAISNHLVGQAVCDRIDDRHRNILPARVWGDGDPDGVRRRAAREMADTARAAARLGVGVVNGFTGSPIWHLLYSFPPVPPEWIDDGFRKFAAAWAPILDAFAERGVRFALEVHPTEIAFDIVTAERAVAALEGHGRVRIQLRPQSPGVPGRRLRRVHPPFRRPDRARAHEGRVVVAASGAGGRVRRPHRASATRAASGTFALRAAGA